MRQISRTIVMLVCLALALLSVAGAPRCVAYQTAPILDDEDSAERATDFAYYTNRQARSRTAPPRERREFSDDDESDEPRQASAAGRVVRLATSMRVFKLGCSRLHMAEENEEQIRDTESETQQRPEEMPSTKLRDLNPEKDPMGGAGSALPNE